MLYIIPKIKVTVIKLSFSYKTGIFCLRIVSFTYLVVKIKGELSSFTQTKRR